MTIRTTQTFIAIIPNYWGKGKTIAEAKVQCCKVAGRRPRKTGFIVYECLDPDTFVNETGGFCFTGRTKHPVKVEDTIHRKDGKTVRSGLPW